MPPTPPQASLPAGHPRLYRVGTLVYTRGALIQVFFGMLWGDFYFQLMESLTPALIPLQLRWAGASDTMIGLLGTSLSSTIGFLLIPFIGVQSDRHRGRLGRRRPFLLWCTPPVVLSLLALGAAQPAGHWLHGALTTLGWASGLTPAGCTIAWIAACTVVFVIFNAYIVQVYTCLIADVIPPEVMGKFAGLYRMVGALGSLTFHRWALGFAETHIFQVYAIIALLYAAAFYLIVWRVKEGEYPPPPPRGRGRRLDAIKTYLRECFTHRFYLNYYCLTFCFYASHVPLAYVVFFGTQAGRPGYAPTLGLTLQEFGEVKSWTYLIQIPVFFLIGPLADRFHPLRLAPAGLVLTSLSYVACFFWVRSAGSLLWWWSVNQSAIAVYLAAGMALAPRLLPREKYGQFLSANHIFGLVALIVTPPLCGLLLGEIRDYRFIFLLSGAATAAAFVACLGIFVQWRRLGGDQGFTPPTPAAATGANTTYT